MSGPEGPSGGARSTAGRVRGFLSWEEVARRAGELRRLGFVEAIAAQRKPVAEWEVQAGQWISDQRALEELSALLRQGRASPGHLNHDPTVYVVFEFHGGEAWLAEAAALQEEYPDTLLFSEAFVRLGPALASWWRQQRGPAVSPP